MLRHGAVRNPSVNPGVANPRTLQPQDTLVPRERSTLTPSQAPSVYKAAPVEHVEVQRESVACSGNESCQQRTEPPAAQVLTGNAHQFAGVPRVNEGSCVASGNCADPAQPCSC